jgi:predicted unusual protein kinase regulating ubiquinone biosynthesis (AarF/ABC1/UbiB family)
MVKASTELADISASVTCATATVGSPPLGWKRFFVAYVATFKIVSSYLWLKLLSRFRSPAAVDELARQKHLTNARRIHRTIARLQGLFIKVGQLISIMANFLPEEFRAELEGLQDRVPPRPYSDVERRLREEFDGRGPKELFAEFEERPIASASIGQVHRARLTSGEPVAVKVQYPDIEEIVRIDLRTLRRIFRIISHFVPYQGMDNLYREIRGMVLQELDFRAEADNVERIASSFTGRTDVAFPMVRRELSTARILTTEWIDGVKVSDRARLNQLGIDRPRLARSVLNAYCQQIFTDGVYHADPHPGNLLVRRTADGGVTVVFIDFGAVAEISPKMRRGLADLIQAGITRDTPGVVKAMKEMGFIARGADPAIFDKVIDFFHEKFQEEIKLDSFSLRDIKFDPERSLENLADLRRMDVSIKDLTDHFHVPKEWIMLERTVLLLMGLCTELDPTLNPMQVIRPYLEEFVLGKGRDWSGLVLDSTKDVAAALVALPSELKKFTQKAQRGELEVRFKGIEEHARLIYALGHQIIYAAMGITAGAFGMIFDGRHAEEAARLAWYASGAFGVMLAWSILTTRSRMKKKTKR